MQVVEIEMLALAAFQFEFELFGLAIAAQKIRSARLNTAEDPDQPLLEAILFDEFPRQRFLAQITGSQITVRAACPFGYSERGPLDPLGQPLANDIGLVLSYKWVESVAVCGRMFVFHTNVLPAQ
jgi:hypothetical protein